MKTFRKCTMLVFACVGVLFLICLVYGEITDVETLKVNGKTFVLDGKTYRCWGDAPLIDDYYLIQGVPVADTP